MRLLYRFALPNLFKPVMVRTYHADYHTMDEADQELHAMLLLIRAPGRSRSPGFVPPTRDDLA